MVLSGLGLLLLVGVAVVVWTTYVWCLLARVHTALLPRDSNALCVCVRVRACVRAPDTSIAPTRRTGHNRMSP